MGSMPRDNLMTVLRVGGQEARGSGKHTDRARVLLATLVWLAAVGCGATSPDGTTGGRPRSAAGGPGASGDGFQIIQRAEPGPILALAVRPPHLWVGTARGLRRWDVGKGTWQWIGPETGLLGRHISALGVEPSGAVWVATEVGVGRITVSATGAIRYEPMAPLGSVTALVPVKQSGGGVWAGGPHGLAFLDGRSWRSVPVLREASISTLDLDVDGVTVWAGTRNKGGLYRVDLKAAQPRLIPGGELDYDDIVATVQMLAGPRLVLARAGNGARLILLPAGDGAAQIFRTPPEISLRALVNIGAKTALIGGPPTPTAVNRKPSGDGLSPSGSVCRT
jgi:hypothetical protein